MITLAALATKFLERPGLAKSTLRSYQSTIIPLLKEYGRWSIQIIDRRVLVEYLNHLTDVSYTTHHRHQAVITALFNFAVDMGYLKSNPAAGLTRRKPLREQGEHATDELVRYLTPTQLSVLYQIIKQDVRMSALVRLLHTSGARIAALLNQNMNQAIAAIRRVQRIGSGTEPYLRLCMTSRIESFSISADLE